MVGKYIRGCTVIKITNTLDVAYDSKRIVYLEKLRLKEDGQRGKLAKDMLSKVG